MDDPVIEGFVEADGFLRQDAIDHFDAGAAQNSETPTGMFGIRVSCGRDDAAEVRRPDGFRARGCAALGAARFEGHI